MKTAQLVIYKNLRYQDLFDRMAALLSGEGDGDSYACANDLIELAAAYGLEGNLWHCFLALCLANNENAYSTSCEIVGEVEGSLNRLVKHDFAIIKELFDCDIRKLDEISGAEPVWAELKNYKAANGNSRMFNKRIRDRIVELAVSLEHARDEEDFHKMITEFYREFGVGKFGLNKAFRIAEKGEEVDIEPIVNIEHVYLNDLVGYEIQKKKIIDNTEAFIEGKAANNVLLFGDAGTGKSSSVKAILNEYYDRGLRIIEVYKHQFRCLSDVIEQIKDRNYKFIIYMDDLSFEETELEYKYLKAIIEGGLGRKPENVLIYATSNRRHLVRESFRDKRTLDDDVHNNDTVQEKLSLVARFGVTIYFGAPDKKEFQNIVKVLAEKYHVTMPEDELLAEANKWELSHGGLSGRTAAQFITYLLGKMQ
ncbi:ATP-binding protein [Clostridium sp. AM58-1XD]|uniref:ATP-binding protein n=1 Tax=Clostridium sp. AM58-1XD TaxID=2292307 RepID=UPI000E4863B0|nr:ATP-binding protein [Clostridium sp. AM58-1XD]RGZ00178.1 ATP-binding protein [Clostridium sp. AM58-1XD]